MDLRIGAPVDCPDKQRGALTRVVVDPRSLTVTHVVVEPSAGHFEARLVPLELVAETGKRLALTCTHEQWVKLPYLEDVQFLPDHSGGAWGALLLWPLSSIDDGVDEPVLVEHLPAGEVEISALDDVRATDGPIGRADGVVVHDNGRLAQVLVREGHLWRKKEVAVPARSVEGIDAAEIHLALSKHDIAALPASMFTSPDRRRR